MTITTTTIPKTSLEKPISSEAIETIVKRIVDEFKPEKIILFGSHAYGDPQPWSDVDLLVVMEMVLPRREQKRKILDALRDRKFSLDLIVRTSTDLADRVANRDYFLREVVTKGKVLYARPNS